MSTEDPDETAAADEEENLRYFIRIGTTDLDGTKSVERGLQELRGIGPRTARIVADAAAVDRTATFGLLEEDAIDRVISVVESIDEHLPAWMMNRRRDFYTGEDHHVTGTDLTEKRRHDLNRMKMINSYKGQRHKTGHKVRGQRTKSTGRTEGTIGVNVEAIREEQAEEEAAEAAE
jgi:SSU ribosomal protein S13P